MEVLEDRLTPASVWDGGSLNSNNWNDRFNWVGDVAPSPGDSLEFPDVAARKTTNFNNFGTATTSTDFSEIKFTGAGYTLNGNPVRLGAGGLIHDDTDNHSTNRIDLTLDLPGLRDMTVTQTTFTNVLILNGVVKGNGGFIKQGDGILSLSNDSNTFAGAIQVADGTLRVTRGGGLGTSGPTAGTEVLAGATLSIDIFPLTGAFTFAEPLTLNGAGHGGDGALAMDNSGSTWAGPVFLASDATISGGLGFDITGAISGGSSSDLTLVGNMELSGNNNYAGFTTIESGAVIADTVNALGTLGNGTRVRNNGTLSLRDGLTYNEPLFLNGDGLGGNDGALRFNDVGQVGTATYAGDITIESDAEIFAGDDDRLTLTGDLLGDLLSFRDTLTITGAGEVRYSFLPASVVDFDGTTRVVEGTLALNTPNRNVILGSLVVAPRSTGDVPTVRLLGSNQIANGVTVFFEDGGVLDLNGNNETVRGLNMTGGVVTTAAGTLTLDGNVVSNARDAEPGARISGKLALGSASRTFTVAGGFPGADLLINAAISGGSAIDLIKEGTGNLVLAGNSTFDGRTLVNDGTVSVQHEFALGDNGNTTVNAGGTLALQTPTLNEIIQINGVGFASRGALSTSQAVTLTSTINVQSDAVIQVESGGVLTHNSNLNNGGQHRLTKEGVGTLTLASTASVVQTGETHVLQGTLILGQTAASALRGDVFIADVATVRLDRPNQISDTADVSVDGTFNLNNNNETILGLTMTGGSVLTGSGTLTVSGDVTTNASADTSFILGSVSLGDGPTGTVRTWTTADGTAVTDLAMLGTITDGANSAIGLAKAGAGTLQFAGSLFGEGVNPHTFGGVLRVNDGELQLNHADGVSSVGISNIFVGDGLGGLASARLKLLSDEQIPNSRTVTVNGDGQFNVNGHTEQLANLAMNGGSVETGTGVLGVLDTVSSLGAAVTSVINGRLNLADASTNIFVTDNAAVSDDLLINAIISGTTTVSLAGAGRVVTPAVNTLTGQTIIRRGFLDLRGGSMNGSDVQLDTTDANALSGGLTGPGSIKSLSVTRGVVSPVGVLTVLGPIDLDTPSAGHAPDARLVIFVAGTNPGQFSQLVSNTGVDLGAGTTTLDVQLTADVAPNVDMEVVVNDSQLLTNGKFKNLSLDPSAFNATGPGPGETRPFFVDYAADDGNDTVIRRNTGSMFPNRAVTTQINEGGLVTLTGDIHEPDVADSFRLEINWGDGQVQVITFAPGTQQVSIQHRYTDDPAGADDRYTIRLSWRDPQGEGNSGELVTTVLNVDPAVDAGGPAIVRDDAVFKRRGVVRDPGADVFSATVDYGDGGGAEALRVNGDKSFRLRHKFRTPGVYRVTVTVTDGDGGVGTDSFLVVVLPKGRGRQLNDSLWLSLAQQTGAASDLLSELARLLHERGR